MKSVSTPIPWWLIAILLLPVAVGISADGVGGIELPEPDLSALESDVRTALTAARVELERQLSDPQVSARQAADAVAAMGRLYQAHLILGPALACFRHATDLAPDDYRWPYHLGYAEEQSGHLAAAAESYARVLALQPGLDVARLRLGQALLESGELARARPLLEAAARPVKLRPAALFELGKLAYAERDYAAARDALQRALALDPQATRIHYTLALVYRQLGDAEAARRHLVLRGDLEPEFPDDLIDPLRGLSTGQRLLFYMGMNAAHRGDFKAATRLFGEGLVVAPANQAARVSLARFHYLEGEVAAAQTLLQEVPTQAREAVLAGFLLGVLEQAAGRLDAAIARYSSALALDPTHPGLNYYLGHALYLKGNFAAASRHYRTSLERAEGNAGAHFWAILADIRAATPHPALRQSLEVARQRHPDNPAIGYFLAALLAASPIDAVRDGSRAQTLASDLYDRRPSPEHAELLAMAWAENGDFGAALELQSRAIRGAYATWQWDLLVRLEANKKDYERGQPCRQPWSDDSLAQATPPFDAKRAFESYPPEVPY